MNLRGGNGVACTGHFAGDQLTTIATNVAADISEASATESTPILESITLSDKRDGHPFGRYFWFAYASNTSLMVGVSAVSLRGFRYQSGWRRVRARLDRRDRHAGAISMRVFQGVGIDRYGAGNIWMVSVAMVCVSLLAHTWIDSLTTPAVYFARILYTTSLAGAFGASITFISSRAPHHRTGEMIGVLGSSGFVGIALGPAFADWLFSLPGSQQVHVDGMFYCAASMTGLALILAFLATLAGDSRPVNRRRLPLLRIIRRYHPGSILIVGVAMGIGIGIPFSFLRTFAAELGINQIRGYFLVYAFVAFVTRVLCRRWPDRWGVKRSILLGLIFLTSSMISYLLVRDVWSLMIPASLGGLAHAFVFPAAMSGGSLAFPIRYRGLATTLMLTMFDFGSLVGQPAVGSIVHFAKLSGWPAYPTMFVAVAIFLGTVTIGFALSSGTHSAGQRPTARLIRNKIPAAAA